jgi:hypothetical protein
VKPGVSLAALMPHPLTGTGISASPFRVAAGFTFGDGHRHGRGSRSWGAVADLHGGKDAALLPHFANCTQHRVKMDGSRSPA